MYSEKEYSEDFQTLPRGLQKMTADADQWMPNCLLEVKKGVLQKVERVETRLHVC